MGIRIGAAVAVLVLVGATAYLVLRPSVEAASATDPGVVVECSAATGVSADACRAWGDEVLARGAPSHTFEMDDLARLVLDRSMLGLGPTCDVSYFISRDAQNRVWHQEVACGQG